MNCHYDQIKRNLARSLPLSSIATIQNSWTRHLTTAGFKINAYVSWTLRLNFQARPARMRMPADRRALIRALLEGAPLAVREY